MTATTSNYNLNPITKISADETVCAQGWPEIVKELTSRVTSGKFVVTVECYPGAPVEGIIQILTEAFQPTLTIKTDDLLLPEKVINELVDEYLGKDPVFGRMNQIEIVDFFDSNKLSDSRLRVSETDGLVLIVGTGASLVSSNPDLLILSELTRWSIQKLQRQNAIPSHYCQNNSELDMR